MQEKVTVFNDSETKIGQTFFRRAKQLVVKGRAVWRDENRTEICMIKNPEIMFLNEEETKMEFNDLEQNNEAVLIAAKTNVRLRRNFLRHLIAFIIAAPLILVVFQSSIENLNFLGTTQELETGLSAALRELRLMASNFNHNGNHAGATQVAMAASDLTRSSLETEQHIYRVNPSSGLAPVYFIWGAYCAWGIFVFSRFVLYILPKFKNIEQKQISAEYRRLSKKVVPLTVDVRTNS